MKHLLIFTLTVLLAIPLSSQNLTLFGWKIKKMGTALGLDKDMIHNLNYDYLFQTARGDVSELEGLKFEESDLIGMVCENPHVRLEVALLPPGSKNTELRLAIAGLFNRADEVNYQNGEWGDSEVEELWVYSYANEIALESSYLKFLEVGRSMTLYGGMGTNLGFSYGGGIQVDYIRYSENATATEGTTTRTDETFNSYKATSTSEYYSLKDGISQRLFGHAGIGFKLFKRLEVGTEYRYGFGYRAIFGAPVKLTNLQSWAATARWVLK